MKRKWLIGVGCTVIVLLLGLLFMAKNGITVTTGVCVVADNGRCLIVVDDSPVAMHKRSGDTEVFEDLQTGDKLLIINDGIAETLPGKTGIYALMKIGSNGEVPTEVTDILKELGWITE